jgi:hypothetical protein
MLWISGNTFVGVRSWSKSSRTQTAWRTAKASPGSFSSSYEASFHSQFRRMIPGMTAASFDPTGRYIFVGTTAGTILVFSSRTKYVRLTSHLLFHPLTPVDDCPTHDSCRGRDQEPRFRGRQRAYADVHEQRRPCPARVCAAGRICAPGRGWPASRRRARAATPIPRSNQPNRLGRACALPRRRAPRERGYDTPQDPHLGDARWPLCHDARRRP